MGPTQTADNTLSYTTRSRGAKAGPETGQGWTTATTGFGYARPTPFFSLRLRGTQHLTYRLEAES
jgi:hypothetical protein